MWCFFQLIEGKVQITNEQLANQIQTFIVTTVDGLVKLMTFNMTLISSRFDLYLLIIYTDICIYILITIIRYYQVQYSSYYYCLLLSLGVTMHWMGTYQNNGRQDSSWRGLWDRVKSYCSGDRHCCSCRRWWYRKHVNAVVFYNDSNMLLLLC